MSLWILRDLSLAAPLILTHGETIGTCPRVFNVILDFDHLAIGRE